MLTGCELAVPPAAAAGGVPVCPGVVGVVEGVAADAGVAVVVDAGVAVDDPAALVVGVPGSGWKKTTRSNDGAFAPQPWAPPLDPTDAPA